MAPKKAKKRNCNGCHADLSAKPTGTGLNKLRLPPFVQVTVLRHHSPQDRKFRDVFLCPACASKQAAPVLMDLLLGMLEG